MKQKSKKEISLVLQQLIGCPAEALEEIISGMNVIKSGKWYSVSFHVKEHRTKGVFIDELLVKRVTTPKVKEGK